MSIGLKRGTVALEPHNAEWELAANNLIKKIATQVTIFFC